MSYRSVKRVLGETNLEWKCRILFGVSLLLLITAAFWYAQQIAVDLVRQRTRKTGRDHVDLRLLQYHYEIWEKNPDMKQLLQEMNRDLQIQNYKTVILALDPTPTIGARDDTTQLPGDAWEEQALLRLEQRLKEQLEEAAPATDGVYDTPAGTLEGPAVPPVAAPGSLDAPGALDVPMDILDETVGPDATTFTGGIPKDLEPVYEERWMADLGQYHYYQPVYWKRSCHRCHLGLQGEFAVSADEAGALFGQGPPLRVVKVVIPDGATQRAISKTRAVLLAAAVTTVFLSMVALYAVVRYVIVKPLQHLRNVSEEISRGNTDLRADIHTNDEFEELADAFNRMLRHLIDAQNELKGLNVDLDAKVDELAKVNMQLYEMNRIKSDFLASMSHELRTPLNSIIGFSDVLAGIDALDDKQQRYVRNIQQSGHVLLDMINDILDLAKMESGKMEVRPVEFNVGTVVAAQCDMVRSLTEEKNIDLNVEVSPGLPPLLQDQGKVQQLLTNLLSNAIKFTPEGGRIGVAVARDTVDRLVLHVSDTGVGIAEEDRDVIFEKFRQGNAVVGVDTLTRSFSGTGLGLSIVRELCKLLGGEVSFESQLGKGSVFTVRLPWACPEGPRLDSELTSKLDDLTKPRPIEFQRVEGTPSPPRDAGAEETGAEKTVAEKTGKA